MTCAKRTLAILALAIVSTNLAGDATAEDVRIIIRSVKATPTAAGVTTYGLNRDDYRRIMKTLPAIRESVALRFIDRRARYSVKTIAAKTVGTSNPLLSLKSIKLESGEFLSKNDLAKLNNVAVISSRVAQTLFGEAAAVGQDVRLRDQYFRVIGVATDEQPTIYVPITTMRSRIGDLEMTRKAGVVELERYELSEIHLFVAPQDVDGTIVGCKRLLAATHETVDYQIEQNNRPEIRPKTQGPRE